MSSQYLSDSLRLGSAKATDLVERFRRWWLAEFVNLLPGRMAEWITGRDRKVLIVAPDQDSVCMQLLSTGRYELASSRLIKEDYSASSIDDFLKSNGLNRNDVSIGLQLPLEQFFARSVLLPPEAARSLDAIVLQDLARKTPFRLEDVYHGYSRVRLDGENKLLIHQWVIRRDIVKDTVISLQLDIERLAFVEAGGPTAGNAPHPVVTLRQKLKEHRSWTRKGLLALLLGTALMVVVTAGVKYWRQQVLIDELRSELVLARAKAQQIRSHLDKVEQSQGVLRHLRSQRAEVPRLLDLWEETTRVLPPHSWLSELRLLDIPQKREQQVVMIGFSEAASSLVGLVARSPIFVDAVLTAPISMDPVEGRERFVLEAKITRSVEVKAP